jgi:hypothetical protein
MTTALKSGSWSWFSVTSKATHSPKATVDEQAGLGTQVSLASDESKSILQSKCGFSSSANIGPKT